VAVVAAPIVFVTTAGASRGGTFQITPPDLQIEVPTDNISISTNPDTGVRQLQFTHITWDAGTGPFLIKPKYNRHTGTATFTQTIYKSRGGGSWKPAYSVHLAANGIFDPPSDYRYPLTRFTLNTMNGDGSPGAIVAVSPKVDYCITGDARVGGVPNTPNNNSSPPQSNCTKPNKPLGLSVGWGDRYDQTDNGQPIDLTGIPDGTYILHAVVDPQHLFTESNPSNNVTDTELQIAGDTVNVINQTNPYSPPPAIGLAGVRTGSTVSGTVMLHAPVKAVASSTISSVQFLLDGQPIGAPVTSAPYATAWTVGDTEPGAHTLSARATDSAGRVATAPVQTVTVVHPVSARLVSATDPAPEVSVINPVSHQTVSGTVPVAASERDTVGVRSVQFLLDGRPLGAPATSAPYAVQWDTAAIADGPHTLSAVATNASGAEGSAGTVTVTVQNPAPPMTCFVLETHVAARGGETVTTPIFHTASAGETLVALVSGHGPGGGRSPTVVVRGAGLTWKLVTRAASGLGDAEIWAAAAPHVLTNATVTSTLTERGSDQSLTVIGMEGIIGVGASSSASGTGGIPSAVLRTAHPTSLVFAVADTDGLAVPTLPPGWVGLRQWVDRGGQFTSWSQYTNQPTGEPGTIVTAKTASPVAGPWNLAAVELPGDGS
jgi:hypothetical protein